MNPDAAVVINFHCKFCGAKYAVTVFPSGIREAAEDWTKRHAACAGGRSSVIECDGQMSKEGPAEPVLTAVLGPKAEP